MIDPISDVGKKNVSHALNMFIGIIAIEKVLLHLCKKCAINLSADMISVLFSS